jgi:proton-dependent oligopeptide transporter, POT family
VQPLASQIYGLYTGLVYLTPILGGMIADRLLGRTPTIVIGAGLMVAGHFMMASEHLFLLALCLLVLGNGAFTPNISTQVGELYAPADRRRDRAYSIFYVGINIGAFFSPLVAGSLGEKVGWDYGFASAGVGMAIGLATYLAGLPRAPATQVAFLLTPPLIAFWSRPGREPSTVQKLFLGTVLLALAYLVMAAAAWISGANGSSWLWLLTYFVVLTIAELNFSPIGLSLIAGIAPGSSRSTVMGIWLSTSFAGNFFAGWLGGLWSSFSHTEFFLLIAGVAAVAAGMIQLSRPFLNDLLPAGNSGERSVPV